MNQRLRLLFGITAAFIALVFTPELSARGHGREADEVSVTALTAVEGDWTVQQNVTIRGKLYDIAGTMEVGDNRVGKVIFANRGSYDYFEAWIGYREDHGNGHVQFRVRGDGNILYTSPEISPREPAVKIRVPIRGCSAFTLTATGKEAGGYCAVWAKPRLIKQTSVIPIAVSPDMDEIVKRSTPLVWKAVDSATGYLVEIQCIDLADPRDEANENRFSVVHLPAETTLYTFTTDKMPKGKWRWRVHALSRTGFLGQMEEWRVFTSR